MWLNNTQEKVKRDRAYKKGEERDKGQWEKKNYNGKIKTTFATVKKAYLGELLSVFSWQNISQISNQHGKQQGWEKIVLYCASRL